MIFAVLASTVLKHASLRVFCVPQKEYNRILRLVFSKFETRLSRNYANYVGNEAFDPTEMYKYLNFITSEKQNKHHLSKQMEHISNLLQNKKDLEKELESLESMSSEGDENMEKLIENERNEFLESIKQIDDEILCCVMPGDEENDKRSVELRILPGIGGEEAKLFSKELLAMYINYAELRNWEYSADFESNCMLIYGEYVFGYLKYEAGVHRVQRVPATENSGRIHTSTCSVVVLPQPKPHEINISEKDLIVEKIKSSGPGGQNVNKRETCVRIKHIPTGITVENQTSRFQFENLKTAIQRLRTILFNKEQEKINLEKKTLRKEQAGTNDYSDKIRTYNFLQNRVTDHRINYSIQNLKAFLSGRKELDHFISHVKAVSRRKELMREIKTTLNSVEYKNFEKQVT